MLCFQKSRIMPEKNIRNKEKQDAVHQEIPKGRKKKR
jgi:hypothetical protein